MIQMVTDDENKNKPYDALSELLKKYYKPENELDSDLFVEQITRKIDSLFHKEMFSDRGINIEGKVLSDEERYWFGMEEYINNEISSLKHKSITDHLLKCPECRQNYDNLLNKKKPIKYRTEVIA